MAELIFEHAFPQILNLDVARLMPDEVQEFVGEVAAFGDLQEVSGRVADALLDSEEVADFFAAPRLGQEVQAVFADGLERRFRRRDDVLHEEVVVHEMTFRRLIDDLRAFVVCLDGELFLVRVLDAQEIIAVEWLAKDFLEPELAGA